MGKYDVLLFGNYGKRATGKSYYEVIRENRILKDNINKAIKLLQDNTKYNDSDFESMKFQNDVIEALGGYQNELPNIKSH